MEYLERKNTIKKIEIFRKTHRIILITGLHGSGKSTLLAAVARGIRMEKPPVRIVQTGPDSGITAGRELLSEARALGVGLSALFLDNADSITGLPEALAEITGKFSVTVFMTGRNTAALETSLSAAFGPESDGTLAVVRINPLSYGEFLEACGRTESRASLDLYCRTGGLPQSLIVDPQSPDARDFTRMRADSFILTELVEPNAIRNPTHLRILLEIVARSTGESLPARLACETFAGLRLTISPQAVLDYLALCAATGLLVRVPVLDINRKKTVDSADVWYFGDAGLRNAFVERETPAELARSEESLAFLRLVDDGWKVFHGRIGYGRLLREDVSFVCERGGKRIYVQLIPNTATGGERLRKREALRVIRDAWPRYLVDPDPFADDRDGIRHLDIRELVESGIGD